MRVSGVIHACMHMMQQQKKYIILHDAMHGRGDIYNGVLDCRYTSTNCVLQNHVFSMGKVFAFGGCLRKICAENSFAYTQNL